MRRAQPGERIGRIDCDSLARVLSEHPIRLTILFGSYVRGESIPSSDIDLAVEFERSVSDREYHDTYLALMADLMSTTGQNSVDLTDLRDLRPEIGASALAEGVVLAGPLTRAERHRDGFERAASELPSRTRRERFDKLLSRMEGIV